MIIPTQPNTSRVRRGSPEMKLQAACFKAAWNDFPETRRLLFHVANELDLSGDNARKGAQRRAEGIVRGVSDLILLIPRGGYHGLMIEMKTETGRQSEDQKAWQTLVESQGYRYEVIRTVDGFVSMLSEYLSLK